MVSLLYIKRGGGGRQLDADGKIVVTRGEKMATEMGNTIEDDTTGTECKARFLDV